MQTKNYVKIWKVYKVGMPIPDEEIDFSNRYRSEVRKSIHWRIEYIKIDL